jgi:RNA polymerase sigma-70 factor (ECF subfamily)
MQYSELPDEVLLDQLRNEGSSQAYEALFNRYWRKCFTIAFRKTANEQEALDIVQNIFAWLWEKRSDLPRNLNLPAYLHTGIKNRVINWYKGLKAEDVRKKEFFTLFSSWNEPATESSPSDHEELDREWSSAIETLPGRMKEIYLLRYRQQFSITEIAHQLDLQPQSVRNQLAIAVKRIRQIMEPYINMILIGILLLITL